MVERCFTKKDSDPSVWAFTMGRSDGHQSVEYSVPSRFGDFAFFMCPVSGYVVRDSPLQKVSGLNGAHRDTDRFPSVFSIAQTTARKRHYSSSKEVQSR
jgi:hypothetical protein